MIGHRLAYHICISWEIVCISDRLTTFVVHNELYMFGTMALLYGTE